MSARSARGLFRATGKQARPVPIRDLITGEIAVVDALEREKDDFYPTPPEPTRAILAVERFRLNRFDAIWEPAAGDGAMVREMQAAGHRVVASDLVDRGCGAQLRSFYDFSEPLAPAILTNPPFQECNRDPGWVRHAMETLGVEYMALLLPVNWLGAGRRAALWADHAPARVYIMRWRIDWTGQGSSPMLNAWFVWDRRSKGTTTLHMLDRDDARARGFFGGAAA